MKILINIPAYNEEKTIAAVIHTIPKKIGIHDIFIQVVDDGSSDDTVKNARDTKCVDIIRHEYNRGVGVVFRTAVENFLLSGADIMVNIDADGQFDVDDIPVLIQPIIEHRADIVIGSRFSGKSAKNMPWIKNFLNRLIANIVGFLMLKKIDDLTCGFRAYSRESLLRLSLTSSYTYTQETIIDAFGKNLRILWVPITVRYFEGRESRVVKTIHSYMLRSAMIIFRTVRDVKPLVFFGMPGFIFMISGFLIFLVFLYYYFTTFQTSPYRTWLIVSASSFLIGLLFLIFASIADMIKRHGKINDEILYMLKKDYYNPNK